MAIKKFRGDKDIWLAYIRHLMADHKQQNVQEVLGRCLKSVDKHHRKRMRFSMYLLQNTVLYSPLS